MFTISEEWNGSAWVPRATPYTMKASYVITGMTLAFTFDSPYTGLNGNWLKATSTYHIGDIAVINALIAANPGSTLGWSAGLTDGSTDPGWTGVTWSSAATNKRITGLQVQSKGLSGSLDVTGLTELELLYCWSNSLTSLNVSGLTSLTELECSNNELATLTVSGCTSLGELLCGGNNLTTLNLTGLNALYNVDCRNNFMTSESDVIGFYTTFDGINHYFTPQKTILTYNPGDIAVINALIAANPSSTLGWTAGLTDGSTDPGWTEVTWSSAATNKRITGLQVQSKGLSGVLDLTGLVALELLYCWTNTLTSINVSGLTALKELECHGNTLTSLNVSGCTALDELYCNENDLTSLNVTGLPLATQLVVDNNRLPNESAVVGFTGSWDGTFNKFYPQKLADPNTLDLSNPPNGGLTGTQGRFTVDATSYTITVANTDLLTITGDGTNGTKGWSVIVSAATQINLAASTKIVGATGKAALEVQASNVTISGPASGTAPTITGSGSNGTGILASGNIEISGTMGAISVGDAYGLYSFGNITIATGATVASITSATTGSMIAAGNVIIDGTVTGVIDGTIGADGNITIGGQVGNINYGIMGLGASSNVTISGTTGNITGAGDGISAPGNVTISGTTGTIISGSGASDNGIYAGGNVTISGNTCAISGKQVGIYAGNNIEISGTTGAISGDVYYGISAGGAITITAAATIASITSTAGNGIASVGNIIIDGTVTGNIKSIYGDNDIAIGGQIGGILHGIASLGASGNITISGKVGSITGTTPISATSYAILDYTGLTLTGSSPAVSHTVTFDYGSLTPGGDLLQKAYLAGTTTIPAPTASGYTAIVWYDNPSFTGSPWNFGTNTVSGASSTLYAGSVVPKTVSVGTQSGTLTAGTVGTVTFPVTTTNITTGSYTASVANLPAGVTVSGSVSIDVAGAGTLSLAGNASTIAGATSTLTLTIDATTSAVFTLTISAAATLLTFTDSPAYDIPASTAGTAISAVNVSGGVSGGTTPYTFSATGLPAGITISASGVISGAPATAGAAGTATITVTDAVLATASITIDFGAISTSTTPPPMSPRITGPASMKLTAGYAATSTEAFTVTGTSPVTVAKTSGNAAITWNSSTYCLDIAAGLPPGNYPVTLRASNTAGSFTFNFTLTVAEKVYYLDIPSSFPGGKVVATPPYLGIEGETITLTITPDTGYELASIDVYIYGTTSPVALSGSGLIKTFTMPASHITVVAVFKLTGTSVEDVRDGKDIKAFVENGTLYVNVLKPGKAWSVYNVLGTLVYQGVANDDKAEIRLPGRGIYIVTDSKDVLKVSN